MVSSRPTIRDVAKAAGVSIAVVSYALNGRPGVSATTRDRVLRVADEYGWRPSASARSVRSGPRAVGLAVSPEPGSLARAGAFLDFLNAASEVVATGGLTLAMQVVDSVAVAAETYRQWWAERRFDLVIVPDLLADDPRVGVLRRIGAPAVLLGSREVAEGLANVCFDEAESRARVATYLLELGHRRIAAVTEPASVHRTRVRVAALRRTVELHGGALSHHATNATGEEAAAVTRTLLTGPEPPSAIIFDTDVMAAVGLDVALRLGLEVPWDVSILAASDSTLCRLATPAITTLLLPMVELGTATGLAVLAVLAGETGVSTVVPVSGLAVRGSTGPPSRTVERLNV